jgi:hypothetical protein
MGASNIHISIHNKDDVSGRQEKQIIKECNKITKSGQNPLMSRHKIKQFA